MKGLIRLLWRDIMQEHLTPRELFLYGIAGPLWLVAMCVMGSWIGGC